MNSSADCLRHKVNMDDDSSSDWDSLTEPALNPSPVNRGGAAPNVERDNDSEKGNKSLTPPIIPPQQGRNESPVWTPRKDKLGKPVKPQATEPYVDFRPSLTKSPQRPTSTTARPGVERKGNTYDPPKSGSAPSPVCLRMDDSDDEAETMAALRQTYERNKPRTSITREAASRQKTESDARETQSFNAGNIRSGSVTKMGSLKHELAEVKPSQSLTSQSLTSTSGYPQTTAAGQTRHDADTNKNNEMKRNINFHTPGEHGDQGLAAMPEGFDDRNQDARDIFVPESQDREKSREISADAKEMQVYYFDEAQTDYYTSKPERNAAVMEEYADRAERVIAKAWREVFSVLRMIVLCFTVFLSELVKFLTTSLLRPVSVTPLIILGDRLLKPLFSAIFNNLLQPVMILTYNTAVGFRLAVGPILDIFDRLTDMLVRMLQALRLVGIAHYHNKNESRAAVLSETKEV